MKGLLPIQIYGPENDENALLDAIVRLQPPSFVGVNINTRGCVTKIHDRVVDFQGVRFRVWA